MLTTNKERRAMPKFPKRLLKLGVAGAILYAFRRKIFELGGRILFGWDKSEELDSAQRTVQQRFEEDVREERARQQRGEPI